MPYSIDFQRVLVYMPFFFFFFNDPATTEISPLPLHDALPICGLRGDPASACGARAPRRAARGARLSADLPVRDRAQPAPPAGRRPPRGGGAGPGARSRGDRGGVSLRPRGSSRRARAARRAGLHPDAAASHEPGLGAPPPERPAYRLRAADGGQRRGGARADDPGPARHRRVRCHDPAARAVGVSRPRERPAARIRRRGAGHPGRSRARLPDAARADRRPDDPPRPRRGAAPLRGLAAGRVPVSRARGAGDEPPGPGGADGPARRAREHRGVVDRAVKRRDLPRHFRASAPARLDLAGGWTDVPPFSAREGGLVVNAAIELHAHAELKIGGKLFRLVSEDLGQELECADSSGLVIGGARDLLKAALRMFPVQARCTIVTRCDAPPRSGLGASGAIDVALVALLTYARGERLAPGENG